MERHEKKYTLLVSGKRIPVSKEIYKAYYQCRDREKYLDKLAGHNISLDDCREGGISVEYQILSEQRSMEDAVVGRELVKECLSMLNFSEKRLIEDLFYLGKSDHGWSRS